MNNKLYYSIKSKMENFLKDDELEVWKKFLDSKIILNYKPGENDRYSLFFYQDKVYCYDCSGSCKLDFKTDKSYIERLALVIISNVLNDTSIENINLENIKTKCAKGYYLFTVDWDHYYVTDRNVFHIDSFGELNKTDMDNLIFKILYYNTQGSAFGFTKI